MAGDEHSRAAAGPPDEVAARGEQGILGPNPFIGLRAKDLLESARQVGAQAMRQPGLVVEQEASLARELLSILAGNARIAPAPADKRFTDLAWRENPFYRMWLQGYLAVGKTLTDFVERSALEGKTKERANFLVSLLTDALAPTNSLLGNPAALKKIVDSGGTSLIGGLQNMLQDLTNNKGMPVQVDKRAFRLGENLALSPGAVVFGTSCSR